MDNNQVALIVLRHDNHNNSLTGDGVCNAYLLGKYIHQEYGISPTEMIVHSPVLRAKQTAFFHETALRHPVSRSKPEVFYHAGLHENASSSATAKSLDKAIEVAKYKGYQTIELTTHQPNVSSLSKSLGLDKFSPDIGGGFVAIAPSWEDIEAGTNLNIHKIHGSKHFRNSVLSKEECNAIDFATDPKHNNHLQRNASFTPVVEEALEAYVYHIKNMSLSLGTFLADANPNIYDGAMGHCLDTELEETMRPNRSRIMTFAEQNLIDEEPNTDIHPVLNAALNRIGAIDPLEDIRQESIAATLRGMPGYEDAMLVGKRKVLSNDKLEDVPVGPSNHTIFIPQSHRDLDNEDDIDGDNDLLTAVAYSVMKKRGR